MATVSQMVSKLKRISTSALEIEVDFDDVNEIGDDDGVRKSCRRTTPLSPRKNMVLFSSSLIFVTFSPREIDEGRACRSGTGGEAEFKSHSWTEDDVPRNRDDSVVARIPRDCFA